VVIEFKRGVYQLALTELARFLPKTSNYHNRYLRGGPRGPRDDHDPPSDLPPDAVDTTDARMDPRPPADDLAAR